MRRCLFLLSFFSVFFFLLVPPAHAQVCYAARSIAQFACVVGPDYCPPANKYFACAGDPSIECSDNSDCNADGVYILTGVGPCQEFCSGWIKGTTCNSTGSYLIACTTPPDCAAYPNITTCNDGIGPGGEDACTADTEQWVYGCWGPGEGTPTPTPNPGNCPNEICESNEDCNSCPADCGPCPTILPTPTPDPNLPTPTPTPLRGTIRARAMQVSAGDTSCTAVRASGTGITGTVHQFTPSSASQPDPQTQSGSSYSIFAGLIPGSYTINSLAPAQYVLARVCWNEAASGTSGEGLSHTLAPGDVLTWDLGYTLGAPWSQVQGGDVYAGATMKSYVPAGTSPRAFILDGAGGYPGIAMYGQTYDFDSGLTQGQTWVSSKNWLVNDTASSIDYYQLMYRQFGGAPVTVDYVNPTSPVAQPASRATPYYVTGDMTTSGNWSVGAGETLVFIVDGNLTIAGEINITGSGFVAFIVNGNITYPLAFNEAT